MPFTTIINTDQMGYIIGRSVSLLLRLIDNLIDQLNASQKPGLLITVDNCHAFDRVSKHFMSKAFEKRRSFWWRFRKMGFRFTETCKRLCELLWITFRLFCGWIWNSTRMFLFSSGLCPFS